LLCALKYFTIVKSFFEEATALVTQEQSNRILDLLGAAPLFATLRRDELSVLSQYSELVTLGASETAFDPGAPGDALYVVSNGEIAIERPQQGAESLEVARFIGGECFGELDLLRSATRETYARATQESELLRFPRQNVSFQQVLQEQPVICAEVLYKLLGQISGRIRATNRLVSENTTWIQSLREQVLGDKLTGLYNNAYFSEEFPALLEKGDATYWVLMLKPDNFKYVNDTFGHEAGDLTLKRMATQLSQLAPAGSAVIRYRGNELSVVTQDLSEEQAHELAERLRRGLVELDVSDLTADGVQLSVSVGMAASGRDGDDADSIVAAAHNRVYAAREAGGNRVFFGLKSLH
jgi:diguanylate cyclase (GGDEF)-like protein